MSTTQESESECECPLCEDYIGKPSSVEAHISRLTDEAHKGEVGQRHRDEIREDAEGPVRPSIDPEEDGADVEAVDEDGEEDVDEDGADDEDGDGGEVPAEAAVGAAAGGSALLLEDADTKTLVYGAGGLMVLGLLYLLWKRSQSSEDGADDEDGASEAPEADGGMLS